MLKCLAAVFTFVLALSGCVGHEQPYNYANDIPDCPNSDHITHFGVDTKEPNPYIKVFNQKHWTNISSSAYDSYLNHGWHVAADCLL